ncbi:hypothetical protein Tco_1162004 [Tanacetum coccineum]
MLLAMKDNAGSNLKKEENDFLLDNLYGEETMEEVNCCSHRLTLEFKPTMMVMLELAIIDGQGYQRLLLGYKNPERLKKAITAQPKMYDGEMLHSAKLNIDSPDSEETLEDAEESRLKMRNKMVQLNYGKLNALYETFVPQQEFSFC